mmetsp:Transcript_14301/g.22268  ORF Transcript_14301/g.22268 Transcript_14301/m.22268 type:complete len:159 (+) Transcript_14301:231-707(+)
MISVMLVTLCATFFGLWAKLALSYWGLAVTAGYSISIMGGFYIYVIINGIFNQSDNSESSSSMSDAAAMFLKSLPVLGLFILGILSLHLWLVLEKEMNIRRKALKKDNQVEGCLDQVQILQTLDKPMPLVLPPRDSNLIDIDDKSKNPLVVPTSFHES